MFLLLILFSFLVDTLLNTLFLDYTSGIIRIPDLKEDLWRVTFFYFLYFVVYSPGMDFTPVQLLCILFLIWLSFLVDNLINTIFLDYSPLSCSLYTTEYFYIIHSFCCHTTGNVYGIFCQRTQTIKLKICHFNNQGCQVHTFPTELDYF